MNILLDTHILIWSIVDPDQIPKPILNKIEDSDNKVYVSYITLWEIALKQSIGKLDLKGFDIKDLPDFCIQQGFEFISLESSDSLGISNLPSKENHRDPFDRMLIVQAKNRDYFFASVDEKMDQYRADGLKLLNA